MDGVYLHVVTYDADGDQETMTWREVERSARAHQAYVSYNTDPTATTPPIPTASSTNATAATAEPEDNTNDYSLRTRKLGSSPVPSEIVRSESEPWQPTTSSAIGLPSPSPPLPPPFLTCATASHHTTPLSPHRTVQSASQPVSQSVSQPVTIIMSPSVRSAASATDRAFGGTVG